MNKQESCYFCGYTFNEKTYRLKLLGQSVCSFCERRLINTPAIDNTYEFFKEKVKQLWVG